MRIAVPDTESSQVCLFCKNMMLDEAKYSRKNN